MNQNSHIGSSFDDFLEEEGLLEDVTAVASARATAWPLKQETAVPTPTPAIANKAPE